MDVASSPQPLAVGENIQNTNDATHNNLKQSYASQVQQKQIAATASKIELCPVTFVHGEPMIEFTMDEVNEFTREEGLHQAVAIKFSYGKPDLKEIRRLFSTQFDVRGNCNIGQLDYRHLLVRFDLFNDYVQFLSRSTGFLKAKGDEYFFRTFPWTLRFNPKEETSMAFVWISMPGLPPNFFAKRSLMSIASAVGKVLAVDKATQERTRPSTARVKVLLDLLDEHPTKVKLRIVDKNTAKSVVYYQEIVYDNLPKYCCHCKHQGHDERTCRILKGNTGGNANIEVDQNLPKVIDRMRPVTTVNAVHKLQGDARSFLNAKRASQGMEDIPSREVNNGKQLMHNSTAATGNQGAEHLLNQVFTPTMEVQNDGRMLLKNPADIPASTVFARMNTVVDRTGVKNNSAGAMKNATGGIEGLPQTENANINRAAHVRTSNEKEIADRAGAQSNDADRVVVHQNADGIAAEKSGKSATLNDTSQTLGSKKEVKEAIHGVPKHGEVWTVVKPRKSNKKNDVPSEKIRQQGQGSDFVDTNLGVRRNAVENKIVEDHSSNVPTIHFSSPHVEKIINDARIAMMRHTNMVRQPVVTLNTSVFEIPSQSEHSFGEHEQESGQLLLSTGNNNEVCPSLREMICARQGEYEDNGQSDWRTKCSTWADRVEHDDVEDYGDEEERDSTDSPMLGSDDEDLRSVASTQLPSTQRSNLNLNAPASIVASAGQKQPLVMAATTSTGKQQMQSCTSNALVTGQQHNCNNIPVVSATIPGNEQQQQSKTLLLKVQNDDAFTPLETVQNQSTSTPVVTRSKSGIKQQYTRKNSAIHGQRPENSAQTNAAQQQFPHNKDGKQHKSHHSQEQQQLNNTSTAGLQQQQFSNTIDGRLQTRQQRQQELQICTVESMCEPYSGKNNASQEQEQQIGESTTNTTTGQQPPNLQKKPIFLEEIVVPMRGWVDPKSNDPKEVVSTVSRRSTRSKRK